MLRLKLHVYGRYLMYEIYLITNNLNDKKYVGLTSQGYLSRFTSHCSQGFYLTSAIKKYGKENLIFKF